MTDYIYNKTASAEKMRNDFKGLICAQYGDKANNNYVSYISNKNNVKVLQKFNQEIIVRTKLTVPLHVKIKGESETIIRESVIFKDYILSGTNSKKHPLYRFTLIDKIRYKDSEYTLDAGVIESIKCADPEFEVDESDRTFVAYTEEEERNIEEAIQKRIDGGEGISKIRQDAVKNLELVLESEGVEAESIFKTDEKITVDCDIYNITRYIYPVFFITVLFGDGQFTSCVDADCMPVNSQLKYPPISQLKLIRGMEIPAPKANAPRVNPTPIGKADMTGRKYDVKHYGGIYKMAMAAIALNIIILFYDAPYVYETLMNIIEAGRVVSWPPVCAAVLVIWGTIDNLRYQIAMSKGANINMERIEKARKAPVLVAPELEKTSKNALMPLLKFAWECLFPFLLIVAFNYYG